MTIIKNKNLLPKLTIALVIAGLGAMFIGSFNYRLSNPSLVKRIVNETPRTSDFGNQGGMNTGMTQELMGHISELMSKLGQDPNNFEVRMELANHFMEVGDWKSAGVHLKRALEIKPDDPAANYYLGVANYSEGKFADSATAFEKLLTLEQDPSAMFNLGILYAQHLGKPNEAKELFSKVAAMDGIDPEIKERARGILDTLK